VDAARFVTETISAIVPTIGRAESLAALLAALTVQTRRPDEVVVADGSADQRVRPVVEDPRWPSRGLAVRYLHVTPPHAVRQRQAAISQSTGSLLLLLDDDVVPEPGCVAALEAGIEAGAVGATADFSNQGWPPPTTLWRWYLRVAHGIRGNEWQGRVIGPLLRFGYHPVPASPAAMEWLGSGNSLVRRDAYDRAGGFSNFFLHRSTVNEDVDLGIKLRRQGTLVLCPTARMAHAHAPGGRASVKVVAEDDVYNRHAILQHTLGRGRVHAAWLVTLYVALETLSAVAASLRGGPTDGLRERFAGRVRALVRIASTPANTL
jgi:GT2 family glycosyltransferase